jgi:hypothetical protein
MGSFIQSDSVLFSYLPDPCLLGIFMVIILRLMVIFISGAIGYSNLRSL